jgi:hypothetical protein
MKSSLIISVLIVLVLILSYIVFNRETHIFDDTLFKKRESELKQRIDSLDNLVKIEIENKIKYEQKLDSLQKLKEKIKYIYVSKNNKIDGSIVNQGNYFNIIFYKKYLILTNFFENYFVRIFSSINI